MRHLKTLDVGPTDLNPLISANITALLRKLRSQANPDYPIRWRVFSPRSLEFVELTLKSYRIKDSSNSYHLQLCMFCLGKNKECRKNASSGPKQAEKTEKVAFWEHFGTILRFFERKFEKNLVVSEKCYTFALTIEKHRSLQNKNGAIAQLVEQRTENPCVPGSIPGGTTSSFLKSLA